MQPRSSPLDDRIVAAISFLLSGAVLATVQYFFPSPGRFAVAWWGLLMVAAVLLLARRLRSYRLSATWTIMTVPTIFAVGALAAGIYLRPSVAGRHLTEQQKLDLIAALHVGPIGNAHVGNAPMKEARDYAIDFVDVFRRAGWEIGPRELTKPYPENSDIEEPNDVYVYCADLDSTVCSAFVSVLKGRDIDFTGPWDSGSGWTMMVYVYGSPYERTPAESAPPTLGPTNHP